MARIPERTFVAPRDSGASMPPGAYTASIKATQSIIQAAGGIVDVFRDEAIKAQEIKNASDKRDELRRMREFEAQFLQDMQGDPDKGIPAMDPSEWGPEWKRRLKGYEASLDQKKYPPVVNRFVRESFKDFAGRSTISITGAALKENRRIAKGTYLRDAQDAADAGRYDDAGVIFDEGARLKIFDPLEVRDGKKRVADIKKQDMLTRSMLGDPRKFQDLVKTGDVGGIKLSPHEQRVWFDKAEREEASQENDAIRYVNDMVLAGEIKNEKELQKELDDLPQISKTKKEIIIKNHKSTKPLAYKERISLRDRMNDDFKAFRDGKISLDEYTKRHTQTSIEMEKYGNRPGAGGLRQRLYQLNPDKFTVEDKDEEKARKRAKKFKDIDSVAEEIIRERTSGVGRIIAADIEDDPVKKAKVVTAEKEKAILLREALEKKVRMWMDTLEEPPTATEVKDYIDKIQADTVREIALRKKKSASQPKQKSKKQKAEEWLNNPRYPQRTPGIPDGPGVLPAKQ